MAKFHHSTVGTGAYFKQRHEGNFVGAIQEEIAIKIRVPDAGVQPPAPPLPLICSCIRWGIRFRL